MAKANDKQWGGSHYQIQAIQPWDYITANNLGYLEGTAIKYITRWRHKNGVEDIQKAIHFLEKLLEVEAAHNAAPSVESLPNRSTVVHECQPVQTSFGFYDAPPGFTATRSLNETAPDWPFPDYLGTGSSRNPAEDAVDDTMGGLCSLCAVDEQTGDSFPLCAGQLDIPILREDMDDV